MIDEILWKEWDPIGINDVATRDEHQEYAQPVYDLLIRGAAAEKITLQLHHFEKKTIGVRGSFSKCRAVARKIAALKTDMNGN